MNYDEKKNPKEKEACDYYYSKKRLKINVCLTLDLDYEVLNYDDEISYNYYKKKRLRRYKVTLD